MGNIPAFQAARLRVQVPSGVPQNRAVSSVGRASALQAEGRGFKPHTVHRINLLFLRRV